MSSIRVFSRELALSSCLLGLFLFAPANAAASSLAGHRLIALRLLEDSAKHPGSYPAFFVRIAANRNLKAYFLGGAEAPDLGALEIQSPKIQYSTHYEHPGLWIRTLFALARTDEGKAYAWGWVVHLGADLHVHTWMNDQKLNYCEVGFSHFIFEAAMDSLIVGAYKEYASYQTSKSSRHANTLLLAALRQIASSPQLHSAQYDSYLGAVHSRCKGAPLLAGAEAINPGAREFFENIVSTAELNPLRIAQSLFAKTGDVREALQADAKILQRLSQTMPSLSARGIASMVASAMEAGSAKLDSYRLADNAEIVGLYGFAGGQIMNALAAADQGNWRALDRNFDTGEDVHDPSLEKPVTRSGWRAEAEKLARSDYAWTLYAPVTRGLLEGMSVFRYVYGAAEYVFLGAPAITLSLANGGPIGLAKKIAWDLVLEMIKEAFHHPEKASRKIAKAAYDLGLEAYRENFRLHSSFSIHRSFTELEARAFVRNWYIQDYMAAAKKLYNETTEYEGKDLLKSPDGLAPQQAENAAKEFAKATLGPLGSMEVGALLKETKAEFVLLESVIRAEFGLGVYPPYQHFLKSISLTNAALAKAMGVTGDVGISELADVALMPLQSLSELKLKVGKEAAIDTIDLIFCIDTTASMRDDIDSVKASASRIIDEVFKASPGARIALVAYRDYGSAYVTKGFPFSEDREEVRSNIMSLSVDEGGDDPEAVYEALLHAIQTTGLGSWRNGVKKIVLLMGDAPPHERRYKLADVVKAAEEVDPAHVFAIPVAGASAATIAAFGKVAEATGGAISTISSASELPATILRMVELGKRIADEPVIDGRVSQRMGDTMEIALERSFVVHPGITVLVFSSSTPSQVIAEGPVISCQEPRCLVELRATYGVEDVTPGCRARILPSGASDIPAIR